jgi:hypothetical protein
LNLGHVSLFVPLAPIRYLIVAAWVHWHNFLSECVIPVHCEKKNRIGFITAANSQKQNVSNSFYNFSKSENLKFLTLVIARLSTTVKKCKIFQIWNNKIDKNSIISKFLILQATHFKFLVNTKL